jgi:GDP/UDP-N,N'-diacetylbacillosamine 2-epimerase (hydrolysing)
MPSVCLKKPLFKVKISIVTGSRAEYELLKQVILGLKASNYFNVTLLVTGSHLSPEFGLTVRDIEADGICTHYKIECLQSSDTTVGISTSMGLAILKFGDVFSVTLPDMLLVLGDRYETFAAATAALVSKIPIAHIHGGELTQGAIDDALRHSITKMSHWHFVAAPEYLKRVAQLGEDIDSIYMVGGLGVDNIAQSNLLSRSQIESELNLTLGKKNLLITFHPVTLGENKSEDYMQQLLEALSNLDDTVLIFTMPNADTHGRVLMDMIRVYCLRERNAHWFSTLGQKRYFSLMKIVDGVIGNSSSGLIEAPSLGVGTVNIGTRQDGRLKSSSVIDCNPDKNSILTAIKKLYSEEFKSKLKVVLNPYGGGGAAKNIVDILHSINPKEVYLKKFNDLP